MSSDTDGALTRTDAVEADAPGDADGAGADVSADAGEVDDPATGDTAVEATDEAAAAVASVDPAAGVDPVDPVAGVDPVDPVAGVDPVDPVAAVDTVDPDAAVDTVDPDAGAATPGHEAGVRRRPLRTAPPDGLSLILRPDAVALAREAAALEAGDPRQVGAYLGARHEAGGAAMAQFAARVNGYRGWVWSVTVALIDLAAPTISEVVLLPGTDALVAPAWVPWDQRIRAGDLRPADLLPAAPDDARLVPAYLQSEDPAVEEVAHELGIGRVRVLSALGRDDAAQRWHEGDFGPADAVATKAPGRCVTCGFYLPLAGVLGRVFGACGNEYSPADGRVVDVGYGCGAHSETQVAARLSPATAAVVDEIALDMHPKPLPETPSEPPVLDPAGAVTAEEPAIGAPAELPRAEDTDAVATEAPDNGAAGAAGNGPGDIDPTLPGR